MRKLEAAPLILLIVTGCASVDLTKTAKGFYSPTRPDDVEIRMTVPNRAYVELATVSTTDWKPKQTAKMHNAIRAKAAEIGAHAVVMTQSGILDNSTLWSTGFALRYTDGRPR